MTITKSNLTTYRPQTKGWQILFDLLNLESLSVRYLHLLLLSRLLASSPKKFVYIREFVNVEVKGSRSDGNNARLAPAILYSLFCNIIPCIRDVVNSMSYVILPYIIL